MPILAILAAAQDIGAYADVAMARTSAVERCTTDPAPADILVCGRRRADRFRVPFVSHDPGDRNHESVAEERARLIHRTTPIDDRGPFLVGGGMMGVSATVGASRGTVVEGLRPLAP